MPKKAETQEGSTYLWEEENGAHWAPLYSFLSGDRESSQKAFAVVQERDDGSLPKDRGVLMERRKLPGEQPDEALWVIVNNWGATGNTDDPQVSNRRDPALLLWDMEIYGDQKNWRGCWLIKMWAVVLLLERSIAFPVQDPTAIPSSHNTDQGSAEGIRTTFAWVLERRQHGAKGPADPTGMCCEWGCKPGCVKLQRWWDHHLSLS